MFKLTYELLNNIKDVFSIKDLENFSGIKAHTIRIWEKRYNIFSPERSVSNFRSYSLQDLQKMLNISYLNRNNFKISKIAKLSNSEIEVKVREHSSNDQGNETEINDLKVSMLNFDTSLFNQVYSKLLSTQSFSQTVEKVFIPFLIDLGLLWQTNTISPANEHFISNLIIQKIQIQTEKLNINQAPSSNEYIHILFLPKNEIHEIGLLYINYLLKLNGNKTVYLGQSIPLEDLNLIQQRFDNIKFTTCFTVEPTPENLGKYIEELLKILKGTNNHCSIIGHSTSSIKNHSNQLSLYYNISEYIS